MPATAARSSAAWRKLVLDPRARHDAAGIGVGDPPVEAAVGKSHGVRDVDGVIVALVGGQQTVTGTSAAGGGAVDG